MARKNQSKYESYEADVFDNPPVGPVGVHRGNKSFMVRVTPFLVVIVVSALLGLFAWGLFSGEIYKIHLPWQQTSVAVKSPKATEKPSPSDSVTPSATATDTPTPAATATEPAQTVNKETAIRVINATSISGYAAQKANVLKSSGYTNVTADNPSGQIPSTSVVWYQNETDKATAQDVASQLGIATVQQVSDISSPIVAVLLN